MIVGTYSVPRVVEESICRSSKDYAFSEVGDYCFHNTTLTPNIPFEEAAVSPESIDASIFLNGKDSALNIAGTIECQNFITAKYIGRAPLEFYGPPTQMGREFVMVCEGGIPEYRKIHVGTEEAIRGFNRDANTNEIKPKEGA